MAFRNILVPTDGSEYTKLAIDRAIEFAKEVGPLTEPTGSDKRMWSQSTA